MQHWPYLMQFLLLNLPNHEIGLGVKEFLDINSLNYDIASNIA
jgi:hypothetical protein